MPNPQLEEKQLEQANKLLGQIRKELNKLAKNNQGLLFAFRRKIYKELTYDERGKPAVRKRLKELMKIKQKGVCSLCKKKLPKRGAVLDRKKAIHGYTEKNVRLLCPSCDGKIQIKRGYK